MTADSGREVRLLQAAIVLLVAARLWLMLALPLADTTEARYGELARVTAEGDYWLMPHMSPTEPFLAKPPLATWLPAAAWKLLGHHEFVLRLPSFLLSLLTIAALWWVADDFGIGKVGRWMLATMLVSSPLFSICAGAVMTDAPQMAVVTGAMVFSWKALREPELWRWKLAFWALVGIATLVKGLATLALIGLPLIAYILVGEGFKRVWRALWDPLGIAIGVCICLGWYIPAERGYPGFLNYFLIGEHFQRFLRPGWQGDRYGRPHLVPWGMIWVYWAGATGMWFLVFIGRAIRFVREARLEPPPLADRWAWCWVLAPLIFFTFSRNIIWTYALTAIPPFALIVGRWAETHQDWGRRHTAKILVAISIFIFIAALTVLPQQIDPLSSRGLVRQANLQRPDARLYVRGRYWFSPSFYSRGESQRAEDAAIFQTVMQTPGALLIVNAHEASDLLSKRVVRELARNPKAVLLEVLDQVEPAAR